MIRLLFLCLILKASAVSSAEMEASGDEDDDEDNERSDYISRELGPPELVVENTGEVLYGAGDAKRAFNQEIQEQNAEDNTMMVAIFASVGVLALAAVTIGAVIVFRRHLRNREQGVYSVPADQGQKEVV